MAPLQGLKGLYPDPQVTGQYLDEGVAEAKANPLASDHSTYGSQAYGYSGQDPSHSPFASFSAYNAGMSGTGYSGMGTPVAGEEIDQTPVTHHAAWPRGIQQMSWSGPDDYALVGDQMRAMHGTDDGAVELYNSFSPAGRETPWHYTADRYESVDHTILASDPEQLRPTGSQSQTGRGSGGADVDQGYGVNNDLAEFNHGHSMRYVQHDSAVFDYTNTHGEQDAPFWGKHPIQQPQYDGPDSPYAQMGNIDGANIVWEGRIGDPAPYVQPPEPAYAPPLTSQDVWAYAG
jgi:hypothetical protein